ncbi:hypothetical protein D6D10_06040 [Aureobasidium pullulans]|uniref:Uncharacterized protein n=1 Tax=Aureobasidium pullulans TaxID=5580 RepID=A0A4S9ETX9_AURPU|nr:hypothetical protein D6D10_06040 [Aureobasidium pullulans]
MDAINFIAQARTFITAKALPALVNGMHSTSAVPSNIGAFGQATKNVKLGDDLKYNGVLATASKEVAPSVDTAHAAAPLIEPCINSWYAYLTQGPSGSIDWAKCEYPQEDAAVKVQKPHELTMLLTNAEQHEKSVQLGDRKPNEQLRGAVAKRIKTTRSIKIEVQKKLSRLRSRISKLLQTARSMHNKTPMKFKGLEVEGQTLEKVKEILVGCMITLVQLKDKVKKIDEDVSSVAADAGKKEILRLTDMNIEIIRRKQLSSLFLSL